MKLEIIIPVILGVLAASIVPNLSLSSGQETILLIIVGVASFVIYKIIGNMVKKKSI